MTDAQGFYMEYRPPWRERLWRKLGFGHAFVERPDDAPAGYLCTKTYIHLDWKDRIRVLISGGMCVEVVSVTDVVVATATSTSAAGVLAPGWRPK